MRRMVIFLGAGLALAGCSKGEKKEPVEVKTEEAAANDKDAEEAPKESVEGGEKAEEEAAEPEDAAKPQAAADGDDAEGAEDEEEELEAKVGGDDSKPSSSAKPIASGSAPPFGAGGLSACCAALNAQAKSTTGSAKSRYQAASQQCFRLDGLVAQGKSTKSAALSQLRALAGSAPAACH